MVFFNYSTMQMTAKVVYYGPGLCGKTTNLQFIYGHTATDSRGEMVSLVRVEDVLERSLPAGISGAVVEVPDALRGSKIVAVVTERIDERALLKQMGTDLPKIAMPKQFVTLPELPKMPSGKIDYRRLTEVVKDSFQKT